MNTSPTGLSGAKILEAVREGAKIAEEIVARVYTDAPKAHAWPNAPCLLISKARSQSRQWA